MFKLEIIPPTHLSPKSGTYFTISIPKMAPLSPKQYIQKSSLSSFLPHNILVKTKLTYSVMASLSSLS